MSRRRGIGVAVVALTLGLAAQAGAGGSAESRPPLRAQAYGIKILLPNQAPLVGGAVAGPPSTRAATGTFAYPDDGSVVRVESITGRTAIGGRRAASGADLRSLSLFGGEITVDTVVARTTSTAAAGGGADFGATSLANLVVLGQPVQVAPNLRIPLADWGHAVVLQEREQPDLPGGPVTHRAWVTVLDVWLEADHAGLPVGTRILVGYAEAAVRAAPVSAVSGSVHAETQPASPQRAGPPVRPRITRGLGIPSDQPRPGSKGPSPLVLLPGAVDARLTEGGFVFPVHGPAGFGDTFGAPRAVVEWHHGVDIFAPLGAPVLAVTDGTLFSVGRNDLGGNRLWLRDPKGNEFYYAHLSAFSPLAANGARVAAGDVIGFVGNTGDAEHTPYHLHFEIHPSSLLFLGYDGAVNPTPYLRAWQHLEDIDFPSAAVWAPTVVATGRAPEPGAILLQSSDISTANGLDPGSLAAALAPARGSAEGALVSRRKRSRSTR